MGFWVPIQDLRLELSEDRQQSTWRRELLDAFLELEAPCSFKAHKWIPKL